MKQKHFLLMVPILIILLCSMEAAVGEALIKGCVQISDDLDRHTGWKRKAFDKVTEKLGLDSNYYGPVVDNSVTIRNDSSYPIGIDYAGGQDILFSGDSKSFYNNNPELHMLDFVGSFSFRYDRNLVTMGPIGDDRNVTAIFIDKIEDDDYNNNDNPVDTRLTTPGEISDLDELNNVQSNINIGQTNTNTRQTVKTVSIPLYLTENSSLSHNTITAYIMSKNPSMSRQDVERLINTYILEAQKESINYEIAIAQMLYATKFLKNRKLLVTHDYMGLNNGNKYNNMTEGVRAHIRYLKKVISNLDESLTTWASKNTQYTKNIVIILYDLNNYSIN